MKIVNFQSGGVTRLGAPDRAVATSKTFRQLARIAGAAPSAHGPLVPRTLAHGALTSWAERLVAMPSYERADLPGVSEARAPQLPASRFQNLCQRQHTLHLGRPPRRSCATDRVGRLLRRWNTVVRQ